MIKTLKGILHIVRCHLIDYRILITERLRIEKSRTSNEFNGRKLILIPHPDDEWIGCSQIIMGYDDVILCNMNMSGGDSVEMHLKREKELLKLSSQYNARYVSLHNDTIKELIDVLLIEKPKMVFVPCPVDWHEEHIEVMDILDKATSEINNDNWIEDLKVVMYQVSVPMPIRMVTHTIEMKKMMQESKWRVFGQIYETQHHIPQNRFRLNERINGAINCVYAVEVYSVQKAKDWKTRFKKRIPNEHQRAELRSKLNDIVAIRSYINEVFIF